MKDNPLLKWIKENRPNRISVLLRHAPRGRPSKRGDYHNIPLTPEGRRRAFEFGKQLPRDKLVRFFHSSVPRCKETAECIRKGVISNGGSALLMGERDFLAGIIINPKDVINKIENMGASNFARKWLNRELDKKIMDDPYKVASKIVNGLIISMQEKNDIQHKIDIHVTHDWNILPVRDLLLNVKHEEKGWPQYLDGVIVTRDVNKITLRWRDVAKTVDREILNL